MATTLVDQITGFGETVAYKAPCRLATTGNITLSGLQTIDGVVTVADDRVLVRAQSTSSQNGIYIASPGIWQRARDLDSNRDVTKGTRLTVTDGSTLAGKEYQITTANPITVGTSALTFAETLSSDAGSSAAAAAASADAAAASATAASGSATAASASADAAATSETNAEASETAAVDSASAASSSAGSAAGSAGTAATSAGQAMTFRNEAEGHKDDAAASASAAAASEDLAQKWAEEDEDVEVEPGLYSAKHWAAKSLASASDVTSVNGQTGTVVLDAADVGAAASSHTHTASNITDFSTAADARVSAAIGATVQAYSATLASWAGVARASGFDTFAATPSSANLRSLLTDETGTGAAVFATTPTLTDPVIDGCIKDEVYTITDGAAFEIDPSNGAIQFVTLGASRTPAATNFQDGECVTLRIADGTAYTITWSTVGVVWEGGTAPTLATSGYTEVNLEKSGGVIRGVHIGDFAS